MPSTNDLDPVDKKGKEPKREEGESEGGITAKQLASLAWSASCAKASAAASKSLHYARTAASTVARPYIVTHDLFSRGTNWAAARLTVQEDPTLGRPGRSGRAWKPDDRSRRDYNNTVRSLFKYTIYPIVHTAVNYGMWCALSTASSRVGLGPLPGPLISLCSSGSPTATQSSFGGASTGTFDASIHPPL